MDIIVDSGSTKAEFRLIKDNGEMTTFRMNGINPFYQTEDEIKEELESRFGDKDFNSNVNGIFFYGAGCSFPEKKRIVRNALNNTFRHAKIEIESDLLAAARALFGNKPGIACILGTGSNSGLYDGKEITQNVSPLGFILGDEGSGATIGKLFVADCLKGILPQHLCDRFFNECNTNAQQLMDGIYRKPFPNRFLASFCPFIISNISEPGINGIVRQALKDFFSRNIAQYGDKNQPIGFVGSIAYKLKEPLEDEARSLGYKIEKVIQAPMEGLVSYHARQ